MSNDISSIDKSDKSIFIIERNIIESKIEHREFQKLTHKNINELMKICSYAMSFDRKFVNNMLMINMALMERKSGMSKFKKQLYDNYCIRKKLSSAQRHYFENITIKGESENIANYYVIREIIAGVEKNIKIESIAKTYKHEGFEISKVLSKCKSHTKSYEILREWIFKKTTSEFIIEDFNNIINNAEKNIEFITKLNKDIEASRGIKKCSINYNESLPANDNEKVVLLINRLISKNNPLHNYFNNPKIDASAKVSIASLFACGNIYNLKDSLSSMFITINNRAERELKKIAREMIRRYEISKRYKELHKRYLENCLVKGWGDIKKDVFLGSLVKYKMKSYEHYPPIREFLRNAGIDTIALVNSMQWDKINWKRIITKEMAKLNDSKVKTILSNVLRSSKWDVYLIDSDYKIFRRNMKRPFIPALKGKA